MKNYCKDGALLLTLLLSLSGCGGGKQRTEGAKPTTSVDMPVMMDDGMEMDDDMEVADGDIRSFFDDEFPVTDESYRDDIAWVEEPEEGLKAIYYDYDNPQARPGQRSRLVYNVERVRELLAEAQEEGRDAKVVVEGHSCSAGKASGSYKLALSEKRAKDVADALVACGIDRDTIKVVGFGQEAPVMREGEPLCGTAKEQAANRRVELRIGEESYA